MGILNKTAIMEAFKSVTNKKHFGDQMPNLIWLKNLKARIKLDFTNGEIYAWEKTNFSFVTITLTPSYRTEIVILLYIKKSEAPVHSTQGLNVILFVNN